MTTNNSQLVAPALTTPPRYLYHGECENRGEETRLCSGDAGVAEAERTQPSANAAGAW